MRTNKISILIAGLWVWAASMAVSQTPMTPMPYNQKGVKILSTNVMGRFSATDGRVIAFQTDEGVANQDLNNDTFVTPGMNVIQYFVIGSNKAINTQQEGVYPSVSNGVIAFERYEQSGGASFYNDWNSDGDFQDHLIAYYDITSGATTDTLIDGRFPDIDNDTIVFHTWESSVMMPLNGDGDVQDPVVRYYTISTQTLTNTGSAGSDPSVSGNTIVFSSWETWSLGEAGVANPNFNGDGDLTDYVLRYHNMPAATTIATTRDCFKPTIHNTSVAFAFDENDDDGPVDADSDADTIDLVLQYFDVNTWTWTRPMFPLTSIPTVHGRNIAFSLEEIYLGYSMAPAQGTELNANGFKGDHIVCYYDMKTGVFTSTGATGFCDSGNSLAHNIIVYDDMWTGLVGYIIF